MYFSTVLLIVASAFTVASAQTETGQGTVVSRDSVRWKIQFLPTATFYAPGLGACGITNTAEDFIVAVSAQFFDTFPYVVSAF